MKIRLHEIEFGANEPDKSKAFYESVLKLTTTVDKDNLKVFNSDNTGVDFNASKHYAPCVFVTSFITDDINSIIQNLHSSGINYDGPKASHLGMLCVEFKDPDGNIIKVNQPTDTSLSWLKV